MPSRVYSVIAGDAAIGMMAEAAMLARRNAAGGSVVRGLRITRPPQLGKARAMTSYVMGYKADRSGSDTFQFQIIGAELLHLPLIRAGLARRSEQRTNSSKQACIKI